VADPNGQLILQSRVTPLPRRYRYSCSYKQLAPPNRWLPLSPRCSGGGLSAQVEAGSCVPRAVSSMGPPKGCVTAALASRRGAGMPSPVGVLL
jgi:hypothetical protein